MGLIVLFLRSEGSCDVKNVINLHDVSWILRESCRFLVFHHCTHRSVNFLDGDLQCDYNMEEDLNEFQAHNAQISLETLPFYSRGQLSRYNGVDSPELYVAIRGYIYDVTSNSKNYGPGKSYHKLVGKDCSRLLGLNRLNLDQNSTDDTWDTSDLGEKENKRVDKWQEFFSKRYFIVGAVVDYQISRKEEKSAIES